MVIINPIYNKLKEPSMEKWFNVKDVIWKEWKKVLEYLFENIFLKKVLIFKTKRVMMPLDIFN
jgi:hypothetical protein